MPQGGDGDDSRTRARQGRELQRWDSSGVRLCSGCVPLVNGWVVLITSQKDATQWGLPKGGWEQDEPYAATGAARESFEEAGVRGVMGAGLEYEGEYTAKSKAHRIRIQWFVLYVTDLLPEWPESAKRKRRLFTLDEAISLVKKEEHRLALQEVKRRRLDRPRMPGVKGKLGRAARWTSLSGLQDAVWRFSLLVGLVVVVTSMLYMAWGLVYEQPIWIEDKDGMRQQTGRATTTGR